MGQQQSQAAAAAAAADHSVDSPPVAGKRSDQQTPPQGSASRGRMDKLFRRAQSTLESRMRGRERSNSPQSPSATKQRKGQGSSPRVSKPSKLLQSAVDDNDKENVSLASSVGSQGSTVRTGCDSPTSAQQAGCDTPASVRMSGQAALDNIRHLTDAPSNKGESGTLRTVGGVSAADGTANSGQAVPASLRASPKSAFMSENGHQEATLSAGAFNSAVAPPVSKVSLPHIVVCEQNPGSDDDITGSSPVFTVGSTQWEGGKPRPRGRSHSGGSAGGVEVNVSRPAEMEDYLAPKVVPEDCGLSPIEERQEKLSMESYRGSPSRSPNRESPRHASQAPGGENREPIKRLFSSSDRDQVAMVTEKPPMYPTDTGGPGNSARGNGSEPSSSLSSPLDDVFVDARSNLTDVESPCTSDANMRSTGETPGGRNVTECHKTKVARSTSLNHIETTNILHKPVDVSYPVATSRVLGQYRHHASMSEVSSCALYGITTKRKLSVSETDTTLPLNRVLSVDSGLEGATGRHVTDIVDIRLDFSSMVSDCVKKPKDSGAKVSLLKFKLM